jgi:hypothetical protein
MEASRSNIIPLSSFTNSYIIDDRHLTSLLAPYNDTYVETALLEWLGLGYGYEQVSEDLINLVDLETEVSQMSINDEATEKPTTDQEEKIDDKQEEEKVKDKQEENNEKEMNEEEEEEQRRRDELDIQEEYFIPSAVKKPKTTVSNSMTEQVLSKDDDGQDEWKVVQKKPYDRRRLIRHILQHPTTLTDQTVQHINDDIWQLPTAQRHDLYRYWLLKYQQYLHHSVRDARREYNQAASALAEYHQDEDYHILKDSIIVAMTTTCAAKYHAVLEKLRKKKKIYFTEICMYL